MTDFFDSLGDLCGSPFQSCVYRKLMFSVLSDKLVILCHTQNVCCVHKTRGRGVPSESSVRLVFLPSEPEGFLPTSPELFLWLLYELKPFRQATEARDSIWLDHHSSGGNLYEKSLALHHTVL